MELDLKDFERDRTDQNIEWWTFNIDNRDYFITLNKENLSKVLNWEELKYELYWRWEWINIREMEEWVKKDLILCLLSNTERSKHLTEALPIGNYKDSKNVTIKISENLVNKLLKYEWNFFAEDFEYRYDSWQNKIHFYVTDSHSRETLKDNIDFYRKVYNLIHNKKII